MLMADAVMKRDSSPYRAHTSRTLYDLTGIRRFG